VSAPRGKNIWRSLTAGASTAAGIGRYRPAREDWYDISWNPIAGCSAVSPGCDNCWAMRVAAQLARMGGSTAARYTGLTRMDRTGPVWTGEIRVRDDLLSWPLFRRQPRRIAVSLMSDLFHEVLTTATIDLVHAVIAVAHWHTFLVLTKRSRRMREYYGNPETPRRIAEEIDRLSTEILPSGGSGTRAAAGTVAPAIPTSTRRSGRGRTVSTPRHWIVGFSRVKYGTPSTTPAETRPVGLEPWPLPNLWPGVSVEDQSRIERIGDLLKTPAAARWVCFEPLLDQVMPEALPAGDGYFDTLAGGHYAIDGRGRAVATEGPAWQSLDWVVAGGEIGVGARPTHPDWLRGLRDQCIVAGVPFFFRQWGEWAPARGERPAQTVVRVGKRAAGRLLDGRSWDEMPGAAPPDK
jgi:protein gp37